MANAVEGARQTVPEFLVALQHPREGQRDFRVKVPCQYWGGVEHLWLCEVTYQGGRLYGRVANRPRYISNLRMNDRISGVPNEITDWSFSESGKLVGGYTIRVLFDELSPNRRRAVEKEMNLQMFRPTASF